VKLRLFAAVALGQWAQAATELDDIAVAIVPIIEKREIVDDFLDRHGLVRLRSLVPAMRLQMRAASLAWDFIPGLHIGI